MATSNSNLNARITSLVKYVLDVKPYHTKLLGFTSEVSFSDTLNLALTEHPLQHTIYHQNVWGAADIQTLGIVSDGTEASRTFVIPPTVMPRFSVTDAVNYGQLPIGDDQALGDLTDGNADGVPDSSYPWPDSATWSHQTGADFVPVRLKITALNIEVTAATTTTFTATVTGDVYLAYPNACGIPLYALELRMADGPTVMVNAATGSFSATVSGTYSQAGLQDPDLPSFSNELLATAFLYRAGFELWAVADTGRFYVPFHNGSKVRVNNVMQVFGAADDYIVDSTREFIQFMDGKHPAPTDLLDINLMNPDRLFVAICDPFVVGGHGYDDFLYDEEPYDINAGADCFVLTVDSGAVHGYVSTFIDLQAGEGKHKAVLESVLIYPSEADGNVWQLTADGLFSVTVQQVAPIFGPVEHAIINEPFDNGKIAFTLRSPWVEYYLSHGVNSYVAYDMLIYDEQHFEGPPDEADFWPGVDIKSSYGQPVDPLPPRHPPVVFNPLGELKVRSIGGKPQYIFELYTTPAQGSFVELRVEQAKQLNPRMQLTMHEKLSIVELTEAVGGYDTGPYDDYDYDEGPTTLIVYDSTVYATHELRSNSVSGVADDSRVAEDGDVRVTEDGEAIIQE